MNEELKFIIKYCAINKLSVNSKKTNHIQITSSKNKIHLRAVLCKNQTKWEMKNFEPPTQIYMEVGPHEGNH